MESVDELSAIAAKIANIVAKTYVVLHDDEKLKLNNKSNDMMEFRRQIVKVTTQGCTVRQLMDCF
jgi:hypothetical protein